MMFSWGEATMGAGQDRGDGLDLTSGRVTLPDGTPFVQQSGTTCGPTVLLALAARQDPALVRFLTDGQPASGTADGAPAFVADLPGLDRVRGYRCATARRLGYLQTQVRRRTNRWTFWPGRYVGAAPWGFGREAGRALGLPVEMEYRLLRPVRDARGLLGRAVASVDAGTPVPLLVGTRVPRHYVLLVGRRGPAGAVGDGDDLRVYEPTSGRVLTTSIDEAADGRRRVVAFGGYTSVFGAALPRAVSPAAASRRR